MISREENLSETFEGAPHISPEEKVAAKQKGQRLQAEFVRTFFKESLNSSGMALKGVRNGCVMAWNYQDPPHERENINNLYKVVDSQAFDKDTNKTFKEAVLFSELLDKKHLTALNETLNDSEFMKDHPLIQRTYKSRMAAISTINKLTFSIAFKVLRTPKLGIPLIAAGWLVGAILGHHIVDGVGNGYKATKSFLGEYVGERISNIYNKAASTEGGIAMGELVYEVSEASKFYTENAIASTPILKAAYDWVKKESPPSPSPYTLVDLAQKNPDDTQSVPDVA